AEGVGPVSVATLAAPQGSVTEGRLVSIARVRGLGIFVVLLAVIEVLGLGLGTKAGVHAAFDFNDPPGVALGTLSMPVRPVCITLGVVTGLIGAWLAAGRQRRGTYVVFALGVLPFAWSFLTWVARNNQLAFTHLLAETMLWTTPIIYGSLSGVMCERSGVVNIAIEGQFLAGAFLGAMIGTGTGVLWLGVIAGAISGGILGALLAFLALRYGADQIIVGVVIVAFCTGLTNYLTEEVLSNHQNLNTGATFSTWGIPGLDKIPIVGPVLFNQNVFFYLAAVLLVVIHVGLFRTRWGLRVRAVGEHPRAAATVGLSVKGIRYRNVILGGVIAGIGGASFTIGAFGEFYSGMTAGLGYVALACMIFGRWRPFGALSAALLFGFAQALASFLQVLDVGIPSPIMSMVPYVIMIAGLVGRVRPPGADGIPYAPE
ncbi:MAG: ABC transporter permease, partial [Acidimicrobiales bacterium]